jgi:hypothetical protein
MKTRILLITLTIIAAISFGAAKATKSSMPSKQTNSSQLANAPIGGLEAEDK